MNDLINGSFELLGGFAICQSIFRVIKDKSVKGVSVPHVAFFSLWGFWNLYYYPTLGQMLSFWRGIMAKIFSGDDSIEMWAEVAHEATVKAAKK